MRFMVIVRATNQSESGALPDEKLLADMGKFNEELVKAGVMLAGEGLHPSAKGARVHFSGAKRTVIDGPFAETNELIAGFWIFKVELETGGDRLGQTRTQPVSGHGIGHRDPADLRGRGLR